MSNRFDLVLGWMVFAAATLVSIYAYRTLLYVERPPQEFFQTIEQGTKRFAILSGGKCVGSVQTDFKTTPESTIVVNGELRLSLYGKLMKAKLFVGSYFNVLEQLVACNIALENEVNRVDIKLSNPNPILAQITATVNGNTVERGFEFPGPIFLRSNGDSTFRVDYTATEQKLGNYRAESFQPDRLGIDLKLVPLESSPVQCAEQQTAEGSLVLDPLVVRARSLLQNYRNVLPIPIPGADL